MLSTLSHEFYELQDAHKFALDNSNRIQILRSKPVGIEILKSKSVGRIKRDALQAQLPPQVYVDIATVDGSSSVKVMTTTRSGRIAKRIIQSL